MNFVDIIIIIFIGLTCYEGFRRGLIKTLFDTIGLIVAFLASRNFYHLIEGFLLKNTNLYVKVHDFFEIKAAGLTGILKNSSENISDAFRDALKLPVELQNLVSNIFSSYQSTPGTDSFILFVDKISVIVIRSISFLITFLIIYAILVFATNFINALLKLPGLNLINRLFGACTGFIKSVIILYIIFALGSPIIGFVQNNSLIDGILESESSKIFYDNNILLNYLSYKGFYEN